MKLLIPTQSGNVRICTLWDFMAEVKTERLHQKIAVEFAKMQKLEYFNSRYDYRSNAPQDAVISKSIHTLKQTPVKILKELKNTCTQVDLYGKELNFQEVIQDVATKSVMEFGSPTHLFSIGKGRYALLCQDDIKLYVNENYEQVLVSHAKKRNFIIYAPHMKLEIR